MRTRRKGISTTKIPSILQREAEEAVLMKYIISSCKRAHYVRKMCPFALIGTLSSVEDSAILRHLPPLLRGKKKKNVFGDSTYL